MGVIILAVIVGLLSGALGSVLGPIVTHHLRRGEHKEEREREIHRELREMIEETLADCGRLAGVAFAISSDIRWRRTSPLEAYTRHTSRRWEEIAKRPRHRWEPYRITDEKLRGLAEQVLDGNQDFESHLLSVTSMELEQWQAVGYEKSGTLDDLQQQARLRLDELRW